MRTTLNRWDTFFLARAAYASEPSESFVWVMCWRQLRVSNPPPLAWGAL